MNPQTISEFLRARPFVPFRADTSDSGSFGIKLPEMAMLTRMALVVARPVTDPTREIPARADLVSPLHIVRTRAARCRVIVFVVGVGPAAIGEIHLASIEMLK